MNKTKETALEMAKKAPRCYYAYDPKTGSRPCTIDMERYNQPQFKALNLPSCPFVNECFTRSDCLYITGQCSEKEGIAIVKRELNVDTLTPENTQSLWPYVTQAKATITKAQENPRKFEEFDFDALLNKYGPEGLWELSEKLQEIAKDDAMAERISKWTQPS